MSDVQGAIDQIKDGLVLAVPPTADADLGETLGIGKEVIALMDAVAALGHSCYGAPCSACNAMAALDALAAKVLASKVAGCGVHP